MKKIAKIFCAVLAIAALAASCTPKDEKTLELNNGTVVLTAGYSDDATRTTLNASFAPLWEKGDLLYASDGTNLVSAAVPEANDGRGDATFEFTGLTANADEYCCFYNGGGDVTRVDATHFTLTLASTGKWSTAHAAIGKANKGFVKLRNISTAVSFATSGENVASVALSGLIDDDEFPTQVTVNMADSTLANVDVATTLTAAVNGAAGTYFFGFFPVNGISGLKLTVTYSDATQKVITINGAFDFKAANILDLGNIDDRAGKTYSFVEKKSFDAVSGTIAEGFTFAAFKGNSNTAPAVYSNAIRLYQAKSAGADGGYIVVESTSGDKICGVHMDISNNTTVAWTVDDAALNLADSVAVKYYSGVNISNLNADKVTVYCAHNNSSYRLNVKSIRVTYVPDARTPQTLSFPKTDYTGIIGTPFEAPVLSGAQTTVTYTSSNTDVATVNETTGAVTLVAAGSTTITAKAAADETYKQGSASYNLTVAAPATGVAGIKTAIDHNSSTPFAATLTNAIVTFVAAAYPYTVYIEQDGVGMYLYNAFGGSASTLKVGDKIDGLVTGAGVRYDAATLEVTSFDASAATITPDQEVPTATVTIAQLKADFATYEYRRVKVEDAVVTVALTTADNGRSGKIAQSTDTLDIYAQIKGTIAVEAGTNIDLIAWPCYYYDKNTSTTTNRLGVWAQADITVKGGEGHIVMAASKDMKVGDTWTIGATCNSGATITYTSSNPDAASVDQNTGVVTALAVGQTTITATAPAANGFTAAEETCLITVAAAGNEVTLQYTLDTTSEDTQGSSNSYTGQCDVTYNGITWNINGNSQQHPWRIGGKSITNVDRTVFTKTAISSNISKIEIDHGTADNITVNSMTVTVHTTADDAAAGTNAIATFTPTFVANDTVTINKDGNASWANCFYRFVYNVSVSGNSNKFVQFSKVRFYGL